MGSYPRRARADGLSSFSHAFREQRCIIPATGFYEWLKAGKQKVPHYFQLAAGGVMAFAGLWDKWIAEDGTGLFTCCIITTTANPLVAPIHERMPAILAPDEYAKWFDHDTPLKDVHALLRPFPAELMTVSEANARVNSAKNEGAELLIPAA
jgi:putative SOS response-associated peptidase YedK